MSYCYEKIITISPKLATLASGQILTHFLMIHRYTHRQTHTHTHRRKRYQYTWKISSCHVMMDGFVKLARFTFTQWLRGVEGGGGGVRAGGGGQFPDVGGTKLWQGLFLDINVYTSRGL